MPEETKQTLLPSLQRQGDDAAAVAVVAVHGGRDGDGDRDGQLRGNWNCHPEEDALRKTCGSRHLWRAENGVKCPYKTR